MQIKVIFLGDNYSGKTSLYKHARGKRDFNPAEPSTIGATVQTLNSTQSTSQRKKDPLICFWDTPGCTQSQSIYGLNASIGVYCVDLSTSLDLKRIEKDIEIFRKRAPEGIILLAGTKKDLVAGFSDLKKLESAKNLIMETGVSVGKIFITSAKNYNEDVEGLYREINAIATKKENIALTRSAKKIFEANLELLEDKIGNFRERIKLEKNEEHKKPYEEAINAAQNLYDGLVIQAQIYFDTPNIASWKYFKENCDGLISSARFHLEKHRNCNYILANIACAILGLGVFYLVAAAYNYARTNHFFFFTQTDSLKLLDGITNTLNASSSLWEENTPFA